MDIDTVTVTLSTNYFSNIAKKLVTTRGGLPLKLII